MGASVRGSHLFDILGDCVAKPLLAVFLSVNGLVNSKLFLFECHDVGSEFGLDDFDLVLGSGFHNGFVLTCLDALAPDGANQHLALLVCLPRVLQRLRSVVHRHRNATNGCCLFFKFWCRATVANEAKPLPAPLATGLAPQQTVALLFFKLELESKQTFTPTLIVTKEQKLDVGFF